MYRVPQNRKLTDVTFFVTASLEPRRPLFADPAAANLVLSSVNFFRTHGEIGLFAFVVMPDHVHFLLGVNAPLTISNFMRRFKNFVAHELGNGPIWEKGYWSEGVASQQAFHQKLDYIHRNPVADGLVTNEVDFEFSSARDYLRDPDSLRVDRTWL